MGTILASALFTDADAILLDTAKTRWPDAEKLRYLNAGQREAVIMKPSAYTLNTTYRLVAGTKQSLPDGTVSFQTPAGATVPEGIQLIRLVRNMGLTGLVPGAAITPVGMDFMDAYNPDWHADTAAAAVKNFIFNEDDPTHFYVTPPQPTGASAQNYVDAIFSAVPAAVAAVANAITLSDVYYDILLNYVLYRCYAKDAAISQLNGARAVEYWNLFVLGLERKDLVRKEYSPNMKRPSPSTEG
ncbi:MAG: DUF6682 family protein [Syntrophaceae bacterium]